MNYCLDLTSIDLSSLSKLESIGAFFINNYYKLTYIKLYLLPLLNSIGRNFMIGHTMNLITIECSEKIEKAITELKPLNYKHVIFFKHK